MEDSAKEETRGNERPLYEYELYFALTWSSEYCMEMLNAWEIHVTADATHH